jgi:hypothetical protein
MARDIRIQTTVINKTVVKAVIEWEELQKIILEEIKKASGTTINDSTNIEIKIGQEEAGSPAYRIDRWKAHIKLETNNDWVPEPEERGNDKNS